MRLANRIHDTFVKYAEQPLFEFFSSSYTRTPSDEFELAIDPGLENSIKTELLSYPRLGRKITTYAQVYPWVMHLTKRLELSTQTGDRVGLSLQNHAFWYTAEFTIVGSQRGVIGSYSGWSAQDIFDTWKLSSVSIVIVDAMVLDKLIKSQLQWPTTKKIILMSEAPIDFSLYSALSNQIKLEPLIIDYFSLPQTNLKSVHPAISFDKQFDENNTAVVIFTSGTSGGKPKGVIYSHDKWNQSKPNYKKPFSGMSVHDPSWSTGKHTIWEVFLNGGKISFIPKQSHLFEINRMVRPDYAVLVPSQASELYAMYLDFLAKEKERLAKKNGLMRWSKTEGIRVQAEVNTINYVYHALLGGRVEQITVGGAAVSTEILNFLKKLPCKVDESYGQTESRGLLRNGYPSKGMQLKLVSLPDMDYSIEDKPYPRGEIAVKSPRTMSEIDWICDESQRKVIRQRYTEDGFLLTGDIAEQRPDGSYMIIDRVSSLQKLANGKYISPERIENVISPQSIMLKSGLSPSACFVTLNTSHSATIVMFRLKKPIEEKERVNLEQELFLTVRSACRRNGISESEIPVKVVIDDINDGGWSLENGILNRSMKIIRPKLQIRLENIITKQSIYTASITSAQDYPKTPAELASWLLHKLQPEIDSCCNEHMLASLLIHIGFDSIQFTKMSAMLPELLDELRNRGNINIKEMQNKQFATPILMKHSMLSLAQIIWDENPEISLVEPNKKEISLLDRLTEVEKNSIEHLQQLKAIPSLSKIKYFKQQNMLSANRKRVLITGGAGFLGAHIVRDLLNDPSVSEIICLVRGSEKEEAASRVSRIVLAGDHESLSQLYSQKIKVVDGDLSKDKFGLQESDYDALIHDNYGNPAIDLIIHAAAMIKTWGLEEGLDTLMGPNVQGTLRIVQLAFESSQYHDSQQLTPIVYVSTISVCCDEVCSQDKTRETHLESWFATFKDKSAIKRNFNAYAITKWMGEQILRESGLPLTIVRAPLLTWNTKTGYGNDDDWLNRLVDACISTRMIPQFDPEASVKAISVDQCSMLIRQYAKSLLENAENHPFTITYPHQGVPGLSLSCLFKKLAEQAQANKIIMTSVSIIDWHRELDSRSYTHPTRFHPLLTMLAGINDKRSGTDELSQMEGIYYWLQHLLSSMPIERPSNTTVRLNDPKKLHLAFFKRSAPKKLSQANTSHSICALS